MTLDEIASIIDNVPNLNPETMDINDQIKYMQAMSNFAETMKPLVVKYLMNSPTNSTFLFKM